MTTVTEKRFYEFHEDDKAVTLRGCGATLGGGGEVLIITTIPSERFAPMITKELTNNTSHKER